MNGKRVKILVINGNTNWTLKPNNKKGTENNDSSIVL
jgi:hypothetical protein